MAGLYASSLIVRRKCRKCNKYLHVLATKRFCGLCRTPFEINRSNANERQNSGQTDKSPNSSGTQSGGVTEDCSICLQLLNTREGNVSELVCRHRFHNVCIETWFCRRNNCPVCRTTQPSVPVPQQIGSEELFLADFQIDIGPLIRTIFEHQGMEVTILIDSDLISFN